MAFGKAIRRILSPLAAVMLAAPAMAEDLAAKASYVVSLGGNHVATAAFTLTEKASRYTLALDASVTGIGQLVAAGTAKASASGRANGTGLASEAFDLTTRTGRDMIKVTVQYGAGSGNVTAFVVDPPMINTIDRVALERSHLNGVNDMLSAFVLRGTGLDASLCNRKVKVFNGMERFDLAMRFGRTDTATSRRTGYQGPVVVCTLDYTPVSGHFTSSEITSHLAANDRMMIWYAPLRDTGYFIPYRVLVATDFGDLSMVLTALEG